MTTPSPQAITNTTEVLQLASLLDHRVPSPDKARIMAWAKQIGRHRLDRDDMLDAVQTFYDSPSPQPVSVGDVIDGARRIKRDRLDREDETAREHRQAALSTKAADDMRALAAGVVMGPTENKTPRLLAAEKALQCVTNKREAIAAISEYFNAKQKARTAQP